MSFWTYAGNFITLTGFWLNVWHCLHLLDSLTNNSHWFDKESRRLLLLWPRMCPTEIRTPVTSNFGFGTKSGAIKKQKKDKETLNCSPLHFSLYTDFNVLSFVFYASGMYPFIWKSRALLGVGMARSLTTKHIISVRWCKTCFTSYSRSYSENLTLQLPWYLVVGFKHLPIYIHRWELLWRSFSDSDRWCPSLRPLPLACPSTCLRAISCRKGFLNIGRHVFSWLITNRLSYNQIICF